VALKVLKQSRADSSSIRIAAQAASVVIGFDRLLAMSSGDGSLVNENARSMAGAFNPRFAESRL
jgi:hypothetical protein